VGLVLVAVVGLLGGLAQWFQRIAPAGILTYLGTFVGALGELVDLLIVPLGGVVGAFILASVGSTLTRDALKTVSATVSHILGGVLGIAAGAVVLGVMAQIGSAAAWLGLIPTVVAAALASPLLPALYRRFFITGTVISPGNRAMLRLLSMVGGVAVFVLTFIALSVGRSLIEGSVPPTNPAFTIGGFTVTQYLLRAMLIGAALGGLSGALAGTRSNFPIGDVLYTGTRTILNALRSIEPLIMGIVFVIWVGIGPFAGVLALALHSVASLGKLYSEQIESIDTGPIEALESTGATRLQTIMYAVVPQIIPPYISFTMYRWDINVRMSTIIGFVGGGGIGFLLQQQINLLRYRDAGVAVLAIAIVVSALDYASAAIRERYT
jgi:phosphonate ABC transporter permease subunit PhnE